MAKDRVINDLEKERAEFAFECVEKVVEDCKRLKTQKDINELFDEWVKYLNKDEKEIKDKNKLLRQILDCDNYKSYVKKIPTMIQTNGLSATLAFMYSKKKTYEVIYNQIDKWLKEERKLKDNNEELVRWVIHLDSSKYKYITNEVMALFLWLRRFAEGMIEKENKDGEEKKENQ
jgi:CRISPR-associated protein Cmr5